MYHLHASWQSVDSSCSAQTNSEMFVCLFVFLPSFLVYAFFRTLSRTEIHRNVFDTHNVVCFRSWYVNAASRAHVNVLLIIDRSLSMALRKGRMELARQAALTVLETLGADDRVSKKQIMLILELQDFIRKLGKGR
jgi:hypothetical protein